MSLKAYCSCWFSVYACTKRFSLEVEATPEYRSDLGVSEEEIWGLGGQ